MKKQDVRTKESAKLRCIYMVSAYDAPTLKYRCKKPVAARGEKYCRQHIAKLRRDAQKAPVQQRIRGSVSEWLA